MVVLYELALLLINLLQQMEKQKDFKNHMDKLFQRTVISMEHLTQRAEISTNQIKIQRIKNLLTFFPV